MDFSSRNYRRDVLLGFLTLVVVLLLAAYFRFTGLMWGEYEYPHPDERFLVWVVADLAPVGSLGEYFNTAVSSLNPANRGHAFFVYGDLPVIATRYLTGWLFEQSGWEQILQTGRGLSAFLDLLTVLLVYLIVERLAGWKAAFAAGLLGGAAVLQIQQSHFFTTDTFSTFFTTLAVYCGVLIAVEPPGARPAVLLRHSALFGLAVGLAMACKINTAPVAFLLPLALLMFWLRQPGGRRLEWAGRLAVFAVISGAAAFLMFRLGQPYAFSGPGFFGLRLDERWLKSLSDLRAQSAGDVDFPPALQWARRHAWFSLQNLVLWGLGVPMTVTGWLGFGLVAARLFGRLRGSLRAARQRLAPTGAMIYPDPRGSLSAVLAPVLSGPWPGLLIVWAWTAFYFTWQSLAWNPTMRYQLPIYPMLAVLAAWALYDLGRRRISRPWRVGVAVAGTLVVVLTLAWAFAFTRIYTRPETRVAATRWIFDNVPGPINLAGDNHGEQPWSQLVGLQEQTVIRPGLPYVVLFENRQAGALAGVNLPQVRVNAINAADGDLRLRARVYDPALPQQDLAAAEIALPPGGQFDTLSLPAASLDPLEAGRRYGLSLELVSASGETEPSIEPGPMVNMDGPVSLSLYAQAHSATYQSSDGGIARLTLEQRGTLRQIRLPEGSPVSSALIMLSNPLTNETQTAVANVLPFSAMPILRVEPPLAVTPQVNYLVAISAASGQPLDPTQPVQLDFLDEPVTQALPALVALARPQEPMWTVFTAQESAALRQVTLAHAAQQEPAAGPGGLLLALYAGGDPSVPLAQARAELPAGAREDRAVNDPRGGALTFTFDAPVELREGEQYSLSLTPETGVVAVRGSAVANESTWDMGLPFRMQGYDPFGGIYRRDLNFEMYWDDNPEKLQRFLNNLDQTDYIFFSSNRQWGTTTRIPERYPLTTQFYRALLGCPEERDVIWCYNVAEPGMFNGELGFELAQVFTSYPNLGPLRFNDQFAEEAFTVYDHPKVMVFRKRADYSSEQAQAVLGAVDLDKVIHLTPKKAAEWTDLLLPAQVWAVQQGGGTWASLFPPEGLLNRYPWLGLAAWYLFFLLLGLLIYPLVRLALPSLPDRGYPLARIAGMVIFAYLAWILGSAGVPVTRGLLLVIVLAMAAVGAALALPRRAELGEEWRARRGYVLRVELLALALFALGVFIRLGNPDLWHPIFGGEKPMDFSYFNAVLKSSVFPPYDPWFAGGYINYYYYGFVLVGMPVKLLGINPSVAYNLILPMLFCLTGLGAFSIAWNASESAQSRKDQPLRESTTEQPGDEMPDSQLSGRQPISFGYLAGIAAVLAVLILGNLGTVRMLWQGWQRMVVPEEQMRAGSLIEQAGWAAQGFGKLITDRSAEMPYYTGDWYWKPSRAIQPESGNEITEFPFFTFLYGDLHAHLIALPVTLLVIGWALNAALVGRRVPHPPAPSPWNGEGGQSRGGIFGSFSPQLVLSLVLGALAAGALRPANTWDQYTYLALAGVALIYGQWRAGEGERRWGRWMRALLPAAVLVGLALLFYRPFDAWFEQGYNSLRVWDEARTGLSSYLVHWGLFLFVIVTWLFDETVDWKNSIPRLNELRGGREVVISLLVVLIVALAVLLAQGVAVALLALPLGVWTALLLFRPGLPDAKRAVLFMIGTALALHLAVELVAVQGDIGRMNTVFKFYYQAWTLLAVSAAAALAWLWPRVNGLWNSRWSAVWMVGLGLLIFGAALYPLTAARARFNDRMEASAARTLDGMTYMNYATYTDGEGEENLREMDLSQDYRAIRWMQANVPGSPVIVEANTPEYRHWGTRFTTYTGLPGVVGWNWHQRQQRTVTPETWVFERIDAVHDFYRTTEPERAAAFLERYNVQYIILGQLERIWYNGPGLDKFEQQDGLLWEEVYREGETVIYRVR